RRYVTRATVTPRRAWAPPIGGGSLRRSRHSSKCDQRQSSCLPRPQEIVPQPRLCELRSRYFTKCLCRAEPASAWGWSSPTQSYLEDGDAAIHRAKRALQLSPFEPIRFPISVFPKHRPLHQGILRGGGALGALEMEKTPCKITQAGMQVMTASY